MIFVEGRKYVFLLQELKEPGRQMLIREVNLGKVYIGESAGAIVACPDIGYSTVMDAPEKAPDLSDYSALSLVDFYAVPTLETGRWEPRLRRLSENMDRSLS